MKREEFEAKVEESTGPDLRGSDHLKAAIYDCGKLGGPFYHYDVAGVIQEANSRREQADAPQERLGPRRAPRPKPGAEAHAISRRLVEGLKLWAEALRQQSEFSSPHPPYPNDPEAAANYIERTSASDRLHWTGAREDSEEDEHQIQKLAHRLGVDVSIKYRFLPYSRPGDGHPKTAAVFPGTFLYELAGEVNKVSRRTGLLAHELTAHILAGTMPLLNRVRSFNHEQSILLSSGKRARLRSVALTFYTADLSFDELKMLYDEAKTYMGRKGLQAPTLEDLELLEFVEEMGTPPQPYNGVRAYWEKALPRWNEIHPGRPPMNSWEGLQKKYKKALKRQGVQ